MVENDVKQEHPRQIRRDSRRRSIFDSLLNLSDSVISARRRVLADVLGNVADSLYDEAPKRTEEGSSEPEGGDYLSSKRRKARARVVDTVSDAIDAVAESVDSVRMGGMTSADAKND